MSEFAPCFGYGVALLADVEEELGRGREDGDDVEDFTSTGVFLGGNDSAGVLRLEGE